MPRGYKSDTPPGDRDEWVTPDPIYWWVEKIFGKCDVDLAATAANTKCKKFFTKEDDALGEPWAMVGNRGWCNPPYSESTKWVEAAIWEANECGFETLMLLQAFNGDARDELIFNNARMILFFTGRYVQGGRGDSGRIPFLRPDGKKASGNMRGSVLVQFKPRDMDMAQPCPTMRTVSLTDIYAHWLPENSLI